MLCDAFELLIYALAVFPVTSKLPIYISMTTAITITISAHAVYNSCIHVCTIVTYTYKRVYSTVYTYKTVVYKYTTTCDMPPPAGVVRRLRAAHLRPRRVPHHLQSVFLYEYDHRYHSTYKYTACIIHVYRSCIHVHNSVYVRTYQCVYTYIPVCIYVHTRVYVRTYTAARRWWACWSPPSHRESLLNS